MILASSTISFSHIFMLLSVLNNSYKATLKSLDLDGLYGSTYVEQGGVYLTGSVINLPYKEAELACTSGGTVLLSVTPDMDVKAVMRDLSVTSVWTSIFKADTMSIFLDANEKPPVIESAGNRIDASSLDLDTFNGDKAVILKLDENGLKYLAVPKTEAHRFLCQKTIPFPRSSREINTLKKIRVGLMKEITEMGNSLTYSLSRIQKNIRILPRYNGTVNDGTTTRLALQTTLENEIRGLEVLYPTVSETFSSIKTPLDVFEIFMAHNQIRNSIKNIENKCLDSFFQPLSLLEDTKINELLPKSKLTLSLRANSETDFVLIIEDENGLKTEEQVAPSGDGSKPGGAVDSSQDGSAVPSLPGPPTETPPVPPDSNSETISTSSVPTLTSVSTSDPDAEWITTPDPSITPLLPTTTSSTTTVTPVPTNDTTPVSGFDSLWGEWIQSKFRSAKWFWSYLLLSFYFITAWDMILMIFTVFNTIYNIVCIVMSIRRNLTKQKVKETIAKVKAIFTRRTVTQQTQTPISISVEPPLIAMEPSAPYFCQTSSRSPSLRRVHAIETSRSPKVRFGRSMQYQIESDSDEEESMIGSCQPARPNYPKVKVLRRPAPQPPVSRPPTKVYFSGNLPLHLANSQMDLDE